jgi:hypothetical protein
MGFSAKNIISRATGKLHRIAFTIAGKCGACETDNTIVIAGSPRSGTTLLLEALSMLPGYKMINEPLIQQHLQKKHGFNPRTYIQEGQQAPTRQKFLLQVLQGQMDSSARWMFKSNSELGHIIEHGTTNKLLVKFCRINRLLPWFAEEFGVRGIIFIVRHPCAVVNSMIRYGQWDKWTPEFFHSNRQDPASSVCISQLPDAVQHVFAPVIERVSTQAEALTVIWCLDHYLPLIQADNHPWILVPYERLITNSHKELTRITDALGLELNDKVLSAMNKPSRSVKDSEKGNTIPPILKWKKQLTARQIDEILSIIDAVNLSFIYSDSTEPDYERMNTLQRRQWQW